MITEMISKLVEGKELSRDDAYGAIQEIMAGDATPAQIAGFITALRIRGETADVIAGATQAMREKFRVVSASNPDTVDTCGTGGDGAHTFNISTASAIVTAGAGVQVAKHGNRSVSSKSGSADVLQALGVNIDISPEQMEKCLNKVGIAFLFAPSLHPAMKHAIGPRKELGIRTIFNILGPLCNPASTQRGVLGVYSAELVPIIAEAMASLGAKHIFIVHGSDGLDEVTTTGDSTIAEVRDGKVNLMQLSPETYGIPLASISDLAGGGPDENAHIIRKILEGEKGPARDITVLNAALAIVSGRKADSIENGIAAATESIDHGSASYTLSQLIQYTAE